MYQYASKQQISISFKFICKHADVHAQGDGGWAYAKLAYGKFIGAVVPVAAGIVIFGIPIFILLNIALCMTLLFAQPDPSTEIW